MLPGQFTGAKENTLQKKIKRAAEKKLASKNEKKEVRATELTITKKELAFQNKEKEKRAAELVIANKELNFQNKEKEKRAGELITANKELIFQSKEKKKRAAELFIANKHLAFQNEQKEKNANELIIANKELAFQNKEKKKRAAELVIANKELGYQNEEKDKRAAELVIANKELAFQNKEKGKRAKELIIADKELVVANKELEKTEEELKVTHERLLFHVDNTPLGYIEWDREGYIKCKSPKAEEIFGWTMKELLAGEKTAYDQVYAEDLPLVSKIVKQLIDGEVERNRVENRNITKDGRVIWCEWFNSVLKDNEGKVVTIMSLVQDITEQKKVEENLAQSESRFRALIERSTDMKTLSTINGEFIYVSPSITKLFGYSLKEILNTLVFDIIHPDDFPDFAEQRKKILQTPGKSFHTRLRFLHKSGDWIWCEGTVTNMLDEPGINALLSNFRDISEKITNDTNREFESKNLNALINNTSDLMWSVDRDFNLITSNLPFDEMGKVNFGKTIPKGGNVLSTASSPEMLSHFKELYERAFAGKAFTEISHFQYPVEFWTEISYYPIRKGDEVIGTACHSRDITELKRNAENLKQSEARLKEAQALSHISNWQVDLLTGINTWSDEFYHILGIRPGDVQPSPEVFLSYIHPDDFKYAKEKVEKTFETFDGSSFHVRINTKDGALRYVYSEWKFEFDKNNKPIRMFGILQDVTERKLVEFKLKESNERFINSLEEKNTILESIGDGFFAVDKNWTVTYWNNQAEKLLRTSKELILGRNLWEIFLNSTDSESYKKYHEAIETSQVIHFEDYYPTLTSWFEISAYPSDNNLAVYFKDITDRKLSEINLNELNANLIIQAHKLAQSNTELEQFAYVASHDLQEPLRTITSFLTLLEKKYEGIIDDKGKKYIDFAVDGSKRMRQVIQDLLEFSKVGRTEDNPEDINLNELINEIQISLQKQINEKGAVINVGELPVINSYKTPICQAFQNLISNALNYSRKDISAKIVISAITLKDHWQFCVADNGIGIDSEYFDKIFILFQRLHNKDEFSGTGIGLPVTKKIIENLGGKIWVESEEGKGSAFYFTLPGGQITVPCIQNKVYKKQ